jgi:DNA invertase Pin-like site-specific DNA recombinase
MLIGYARISTHEQSLDLQNDALKEAGCEYIIKDISSGASSDRPGFDQVMKKLSRGDTLVIWRLDRLGRSLRSLIDLFDAFEQRGVGIRSLRESIDTTTPGGKLIFQIFAALAEFERDLISDRTYAGLASARARGRVGGRPAKLADPKQLELARKLHADKGMEIAAICRALGVSRSTFYRKLKSFPKSIN